MKNKQNKNLPMILIILDGWGIDKPNRGNAISLAKTPVMDGLIKKYPNTKLRAHGKYVGLPDNQVGNSEAGHTNIGAGRLVKQDSIKINKSIKNGTFFKNSAFLGAIRHTKKMKSKMHLIGMLSNGQSPHSDPKHIYSLLNLMRENNVQNVFLHLFTDGRDSPQYASLKLVEDLEKQFFNNEKIATIMGRFYAMDRKKDWKRTKKAYDTLTSGYGRKSNSAISAITESYNRGDSDEFIEPYIIGDNKDSRISDCDSVIFFNLRSDRSRQLTKVFAQNEFTKKNKNSFKPEKNFKSLYFTVMTDFGPDLDDVLTAFPSINLKNTLPMQLVNLKQLYLTETEKYAHVTFFINGGYSGKVDGEDHLMIESPDVRSYNKTPLMKSNELTDVVLNNLKKNKYDFTFLNFAAPDMIGHTGDLSAGIKCCEGIDKCVGDIVDAYLKKSGTVIITADHGNIEKMINLETDEIYTEHTTNLVPFIIVNNNFNKKLKEKGSLYNIAPTILKLLKIEKPKEMNKEALYE